MQLRIAAFEARGLAEEVDGALQIFQMFLRVSGDQRGGGLDAETVRRVKDFSRIDEVQILVHHMLQTLRAGFNPEEDAGASGARHQGEQFIIHAIGSRTATPSERNVLIQKSLAKAGDAFAIDCKHIVRELEIAHVIPLGKQHHFRHELGCRFQTIFAAKEIIRGAEATGKGQPRPASNGREARPISRGNNRRGEAEDRQDR